MLIARLGHRQDLRGALFNTSLAGVTAFLGGRAAEVAIDDVPGLGGHALGALAGAAVLFLTTMAILAPILARHAEAPISVVFPRVLRAELPFAALMVPCGLMIDVLVTRSPLLVLTVAAPLVALYLYQRSQAATFAAVRIAQLDPLTGLGNRRAFHRELARALSPTARRGRPLSLCLVDLDDFKSVNDVHGHLVGDAVLVALAACLREGEGFRLGGDEFAVLLEGIDRFGALRAAERIIAAVAEVRHGAVGALGVSVGVVTTTSGGEMDELVRLADDALYRAKDGGKSRVVAVVRDLRHAAA